MDTADSEDSVEASPETAKEESIADSSSFDGALDEDAAAEDPTEEAPCDALPAAFRVTVILYCFVAPLGAVTFTTI